MHGADGWRERACSTEKCRRAVWRVFGIAVANRHTNNKEMAVQVPAVSRITFSIVVPSEGEKLRTEQ